jgi:hypothetical protein
MRCLLLLLGQTEETSREIQLLAFFLSFSLAYITVFLTLFYKTVLYVSADAPRKYRYVHFTVQ